MYIKICTYSAWVNVLSSTAQVEDKHKQPQCNMYIKSDELNVICLFSNQALVCFLCLLACSYVWEHLEMGYVQGMCDLLAPLMVILDDGEKEESSYPVYLLTVNIVNSSDTK